MRRLDQQGSGVDVAGLGDGTTAATQPEEWVDGWSGGGSGTGDGSWTALSRPMEAATISGPLLDHFAALTDPRQHAKVLYPLPEILHLVLAAAIAGADDFVETTLGEPSIWRSSDASTATTAAS